LMDLFSTRAIHGAFTIVEEGLEEGRFRVDSGLGRANSGSVVRIA